MYDHAIDGMASLLLVNIGATGRFMLSEKIGDHHRYKMDHLACFVPGMLALGALHTYVNRALALEDNIRWRLALICTVVSTVSPCRPPCS